MLTHSLTIVATVSPCPPFINENGKGVDEALFLNEVDSKINQYSGGLFTSTECPGQDNPYAPNRVIVLDDDTGKILFNRPSNGTTSDDVANFVNGLSSVTYNSQTGEYIKSDGTALALPGNGNSFGLGLFNLNLPIPNALWWLASGFSAYQASKADSDTGKMIWGSLSVVAGGNALNKN